MNETSSQSRVARLLRPRSIAVVGASQAPNKLAGVFIPTLLGGGYQGKVYPVNPRYEEVAGQRCYPSIDEVPGEIDHCVIIVAKERTKDVLTACRRRGVGSASIFSSGFSESGDAGAQAQQELVEIAGDMPFIGPNCMGFANLADNVLAASSSLMRHAPKRGDIALLSQSGGIAFASFGFQALAMDLHFSHIINTGNSAGISYTELVEFLFDEPNARVILVVAESEKVVGEVLDAVRQHGLRKPIVLLKLGRGKTGTRMALSHTGSLAGDYRMIQGCAEQIGIVCANDIDEALGDADLLRHGFGPANAKGIAAICISGGNIALFADRIDETGLDFAELSPATEKELRDILPSYISVQNPIDITALGMEEPNLHARVIRSAAQDRSVSTLIPILTGAADYSPVCQMLADFRVDTQVPVIALWNGGSLESRSPEILRRGGIPIFRSSSLLARCLHQIERADSCQSETSVSARRGTASLKPGPLTEGAAFTFLKASGIAVPEFRICSRSDLTSAAAAVGYPVVVKLNSAETHISDTGGVALNICDEAALIAAERSMLPRPEESFLVARYLPGQELIISAFRHPYFGPVMMIGSGGRMVELQSDVRFIGLPAQRKAIERALRETLVGRALHEGFRGASGFDATVDLIVNVGAVVGSHSDLVQIELNPVTAGSHGAAAVDAYIVGAPD